MATQSEAALENGLIKTLMDNSYERVFIKEEENLKANFKVQLEKHNQKALALIGRAQFTDKEFEKILIYLEGGTRFEKAKKLRDLYPLETEDGQRIWGRISQPTQMVSERISGIESNNDRGTKKMPL